MQGPAPHTLIDPISPDNLRQASIIAGMGNAHPRRFRSNQQAWISILFRPLHVSYPIYAARNYSVRWCSLNADVIRHKGCSGQCKVQDVQCILAILTGSGDVAANMAKDASTKVNPILLKNRGEVLGIAAQNDAVPLQRHRPFARRL